MNRNFIFFSLAGLAVACATSPTGRKQLLLQSDANMDSMGAQSFEEIKKQTPIETNPKINAYVKCVAIPITQAARGRTPVDQWEIVVFKDKTANAFALPGGKIGVNTGLLPIAKNDAELATVIGHEVGHVIAKHGNERVTQQESTQVGLAVADFLSGSMDPSKKQLMLAAAGGVAQYGILLPFSRAQESEADLIGLDLMATAGFDPQQSVELWKNMSAGGGKGSSEWMSTHPSDETRMKALADNIPKHLGEYESAHAAGRSPHCVLSK